MKQVVVKKGEVLTEIVSAPSIDDNSVLIKVDYSCISAGTEIMGIAHSGKTLLKKAMDQPEKVKQAVEIYKKEGASSVLKKVGAMSDGKSSGYSVAGTIVEVGSNIRDFKVGDRVAAAGAGYAVHAEIVAVPRNLCMRIPKGLSMEEACTVTLGGIAMQGVRRLKPELGETVAVVGLGLIGQLAAQMLEAAGCHVIGIDFDSNRTAISRKNGCEYVFNSSVGSDYKDIMSITNNKGVDGVLIAAATDSNDVLDQCFEMCRKKGRVVLVGVVGCEFSREVMYQKELDFMISTSYGPGRYDESYEVQGQDYPYAYVRWTENRNMEEYLRLLSMGKISLKGLIGRSFDIDDANKAFEYLTGPENKSLITTLRYERDCETIFEEQRIDPVTNVKGDKRVNVGLVGAGAFAKAAHLPNMQKLDEFFNIYAIMSRTGLNAKNIADAYEAEYSTTDYEKLLNDPNIDLIVICTRHDQHADLACAALEHDKSVLLEKPLALNENELERVMRAADSSKGCFMVGYNRRYSPAIQAFKKEVDGRKGPLIVDYQMNAGFIPLDSWVHGKEGGGRIIGEMCHIIDLCNFLTGSEIVSVSVNSIAPAAGYAYHDNVVAVISYSDGSIANITYTSMGNQASGKEKCTVYFDNKTLEMNDYLLIKGYGTKLKSEKYKRQDKGHFNELIAMYEAMATGLKYPIDKRSLREVSIASFLIDRQAKKS